MANESYFKDDKLLSVKDDDVTKAFKTLAKAPEETKESIMNYLYGNHISIPIPFSDNNMMSIFSINDLKAEFPNYDSKDVLDKIYEKYVLNNNNYDVRIIDSNDDNVHVAVKIVIGHWQAIATYIISENGYNYTISEQGKKLNLDNYINEIKLVGHALSYDVNHLTTEQLTDIIINYIVPIILTDVTDNSTFEDFLSLIQNKSQKFNNLPENIQKKLYEKII